MPTLGNPTGTIEILKKYHFNFQKRYGQNFLIDSNILEKIVESAGITGADCVLEIGPGIGTMTQYLAESAQKVIAVEIDRALIPILEDTLSPYDNVTVINEDILKMDICGLIREKNQGKPVKVVANLPYYITTPIIMYRRKWRSGCRWAPEPKITGRCPLPCSITQGRRWSQASPPAVLFQGPVWEAR